MCLCTSRKVASNLLVVRDYHYSNSPQQAVWLPPELHSISQALLLLLLLLLDNKQKVVISHIHTGTLVTHNNI